jgi:cytochrome c-type biogenesis protein
MQAPALYIAFAAGLLSFLSPCVLPLVPSYLGYLSGTAVIAARAGVTAGGAATMSRTQARWIVMAHALMFVLGFTIIFVVVIGGLAGALSTALRENKPIIDKILGLVLIIFGLQMMGLINISFLNYTRRLGDQMRPHGNASYFRSLLIGMGFAAGWTPCFGPTIGLIFTMGMNGQQWEAILPAIVYSLGLGIPFLLAALAMGQISTGIKKITRRMYSLKLGNWTIIDQVNIVSLISGALIVLMGLLVLTDSLTRLGTLFPNTQFFNINL